MKYVCDIPVKSSRSLSHILMSSCTGLIGSDIGVYDLSVAKSEMILVDLCVISHIANLP